MSNLIAPESDGDLPPSLEWLLQRLRKVINKSTLQMTERILDVESWYQIMRRELALHIQSAYMAGQGSSYIGTTEAGHIYDFVKSQVGFLDNFKMVIQSAPEWQAGWNARAESYARGIVAPYWKGKTKMLPLPAVPGDLLSVCGQLCACLWDVKTIDEEAGDYDCYWRLNASRTVQTEHCPDCIVRAQSWNPLRIRGGYVQV